MNQQVNERISLINAGKVPNGYENTKLGIMPIEWQNKKMNKVATPIKDKAGKRKFETLSISAGIGFVNQAQKFGKELSGAQYVNYIVIKNGDFSYNKGNSKKYPQGCIYMLEDREIAAVPNVFNSFRLKEGNPQYYKQLFVSGFLNKQLYRLINSGVRNDGLLNLYDNDFYNCYLPVPPLPEQEKIAEVLTTCEKMIELKEKLITEKQQQKKWLTQNLLTGKKRIKNFNEAWKTVKLNKISKISIGLVTTMTTNYVDSGTLLIRNSDIMPNKVKEVGLINLSNNFAEQNKSRRLKINDIVTVHTGDVGTSAIIDKRLEGSIGFATLNTSPNTNLILPQFLCHYFNSVIFKTFALKMSTGDGRNNFNLRDFEKSKIPLPSLIEQNAIANILSVADQEIELLQIGLEEWKYKKKALMQLLLTGKVRVNA